MKRIALKIDVDTYRGTLSGVPALIEILKRYNAGGTFFFSLGPDHSGREQLSSSLGRFYGRSTRLYGRLLPSPNIGTRCTEIMRHAINADFETGVHAWDRVGWEQKVHQAGNSWIEGEMSKSCTRFAETFAEMPRAHGAAGWQMTRHALRLTQRFGFSYASDCRGNHPFIPVIDGEIIACPQLPSTLPTLDEILMLEPGYSPDQAADRILQLSSAIVGDHVFTLRAELEGMKFCSTLERLIGEWKNKGYQLVALREIHSMLDIQQVPLHNVRFAEVPGRAGPRMMQGQPFLQD